MFVESVNWSILVLYDSLGRCIFRTFCFLFCNIILQSYIRVALGSSARAGFERVGRKTCHAEFIAWASKSWECYNVTGARNMSVFSCYLIHFCVPNTIIPPLLVLFPHSPAIYNVEGWLIGMSEDWFQSDQPSAEFYFVGV